MFRIIPHRLLTEPKAEVIDDTGSTATLHIDGLVCSACATNVRGHLERIPGVRNADVDLDRGKALVTYDTSRAAPKALVSAVERSVLFPKARRVLANSAGWARARHGQQRRSGSSDPDKTSAGSA